VIRFALEERVLGFKHWDDEPARDAMCLQGEHPADPALDLAPNSYRGVFGSDHGRTCTATANGSQPEEASGIARLLWGQGCGTIAPQGWKDTRIALCVLPRVDPLGFAHVHLPADALDENIPSDGWVFALVASGYPALSASHGTELIRRAPSAYWVLRSHGGPNSWVYTLGRADTIGVSRAFSSESLSATWKRRVFLFGLWLDAKVRSPTSRGTLAANGTEKLLSGGGHYDSPFCAAGWRASHVEVRTETRLLELNSASVGPS
jgi:hypothetical protein